MEREETIFVSNGVVSIQNCRRLAQENSKNELYTACVKKYAPDGNTFLMTQKV